MYNFHNNYNFYKEINFVLYKNMIAMASSFLYGNDQTPYSSIIIFGYPNTTDVTFEISNYLFNNNDIKIYQFQLMENLKWKIIFLDILIQGLNLLKINVVV
jgi:hypothetical protein